MKRELQTGQPTVAILLGTYNGEIYLKQQLDSFLAQSLKDWHLWASDDRSTDRTVEMLKAYKSGRGAQRVSVRYGPGKGFVANFLSMVVAADIDAHYFAYSDQDDIWDPDKLERAVGRLSTVGPDVPALYCSRTKLIDAENHEIGLSPLFSRPPGFCNALTQNIGGGNTMVFNRAAREVLRLAGADLAIPTHDWWTYLAVSAVGGQILYDPRPSLRYRQHAANVIGVGAGWAARRDRLTSMWRGRDVEWHDANIAALRNIEARMPDRNVATLRTFVAARQAGVFTRITLLWRSGIYRATALQQFGLFLAAVLGRI